ncbi:hypothetical protein GCM10027610_053720 [Dactylosporangium cerinum]
MPGPVIAVTSLDGTDWLPSRAPATAEILKRYAWPGVSPVTVHGPAVGAAAQVPAATAVYGPPVEPYTLNPVVASDGPDQATVTVPGPVTVTFVGVGAPGAATATSAADGFDATPVPAALPATIWKRYEVPPVSPVTVQGLVTGPVTQVPAVAAANGPVPAETRTW